MSKALDTSKIYSQMFFPSLPDRAANAFRIIFDIHKFLELNIVAVVNKIEDAQGFTIFICGYTIFYLNPFKDLNFFSPLGGISFSLRWVDNLTTHKYAYAYLMYP